MPIQIMRSQSPNQKHMQSNFVIAVLLLYLPVGAAIVTMLRGIKGVMAAIIIGWIFLPPARGINLPGLPLYTKEFAVIYAVILGVIISDSSKILNFKFRLIDIPVVIFVTSPFMASVTNGLGAYDGLSGVYSNIFIYAAPYFIGRIYIQTPNDIKLVAIGIVVSGLAIIPFVLWESRMSPNLNHKIYGYHAAQFGMSVRLGGYRPTIFMRHGLEVGLWLATSAAVAGWLALNAKKQVRIFNFPIMAIAFVAIGTAIISRSLGSIVLLFGALSTCVIVRTTGLKIMLIALVLTPPIYLGSRITQVWSPDSIVTLIEQVDPSRADSLKSRFLQETRFSEHALKKPIFGWGGYNRYRPEFTTKKENSVDGLTTIILGSTGLIGLISYLAMNTLPSLSILLKIKSNEIRSAIWAPALAIILGISVYSLDMMLNSFFTPLHLFAIGALASTSILLPKWKHILREHQLQNSPPEPKDIST